MQDRKTVQTEHGQMFETHLGRYKKVTVSLYAADVELMIALSKKLKTSQSDLIRRSLGLMNRVQQKKDAMLEQASAGQNV